jgi:hypothetical protein
MRVEPAAVLPGRIPPTRALAGGCYRIESRCMS